MACCQMPDARKCCPFRRGFRHKPSRPCSEGRAFDGAGYEAPGGGFWVLLGPECMNRTRNLEATLEMSWRLAIGPRPPAELGRAMMGPVHDGG
ncbi:hypothetical protein Taro_016711 [Colocasia esculenta]|uniref:Uncharacterized protein n=1 Tax=Colocasia esculenta TaxID=4460 RepID=A0A843ULH8_COLES|nr:hypothetical protein [Colocasia esculenta]